MSTLDAKDLRILEFEQLVREQQQLVREQQQRLGEQEQRIGELETLVRELMAQNSKQLERLESWSQTSSKPPSTDSLAQRDKRIPKPKSKRKAGAQKGHKGHHRELWPPERVDHVITHYPTQCECGHELTSQTSQGQPQRRQVFELVPKLVECTEHQYFTCQCRACGKLTQATPSPAERQGWGTRLASTVVALHAMMFASRRRLHWFMAEFLGVPSSLGTVDKTLMQGSQALEKPYEQAHQKVMEATYLGADETRWHKGKEHYVLWLVQCQDAAYYRLADNRRKETAEELLAGAQAKAIVTDRYGGYDWLGDKQQACHAHLLREWQAYAAREGPNQKHYQVLVRETKGLLKEHRAYREGELDRQQFVTLAKARKTQVEKTCLTLLGREGIPPLVNWIRSPKGARAWTFLEHDGLDLTNNKSERELRGCVIHRKLSYGSKSEQGLRLMERVWTVTQTCQLQGKSLLDYLTQAISSYRLGLQPLPLC